MRIFVIIAAAILFAATPVVAIDNNDIDCENAHFSTVTSFDDLTYFSQSEVEEYIEAREFKQKTEWQKALSQLPKDSFLWNGLIQHFKDLPEQELLDVFKTIAKRNLLILIHKANIDIKTLSTAEKRSMVLLMTQNWRLIVHVRDATSWMGRFKEFSLKKFYGFLYSNEQSKVAGQIPLAVYLEALAKNDAKAHGFQKSRSIVGYAVEDINRFIASDNIVIALAEHIAALETQAKKTWGLARLLLRAQIRYEQKLFSSITSQSTVLRQEKAEILKPKSSETPETAKAKGKNLITYAALAAAVLFGHQMLPPTQDINRPGININESLEKYHPSAVDMENGGSDLESLIIDEFSSDPTDHLSDEELKAAIKKYQEDYPQINF